MQIFGVAVPAQGRQRFVSTLLDTASQRSYVSERIMKSVKMHPIRKEKIIHALFRRK